MKFFLLFGSFIICDERMIRVRKSVVLHFTNFIEDFVLKVVDSLVVHAYISKLVRNKSQVDDGSK